MSDLKLNRSSDLDFSSKRAHLVGGANAVAQQLRIRFRTFLGEWFFDRTAGFPWFQTVLSQKGDVQRFEGLFRQVILSTPKVLSIETFSFAFERATRTLRLTFRAKTSEGVLDFDDAFDLEDEVEAPLRAASTWRTSSSAVVAPNSYLWNFETAAGYGVSGTIVHSLDLNGNVRSGNSLIAPGPGSPPSSTVIIFPLLGSNHMGSDTTFVSEREDLFNGPFILSADIILRSLFIPQGHFMEALGLFYVDIESDNRGTLLGLPGGPYAMFGAGSLGDQARHTISIRLGLDLVFSTKLDSQDWIDHVTLSAFPTGGHKASFNTGNGIPIDDIRLTFL